MMPSISLLWITDPWSTLTHAQDTTLRLAEEAHKLGIQSYWSGTDIIFGASSTELKVVPVTENFTALSETEVLKRTINKSASNFSQYHYRVDPPVDFNYISIIEKLLAKGVNKKLILNPIELITKHSEKIPPAELAHLAPKMAVVQNSIDISRAFSAFQHDVRFVTKPLNLAQSIGVKQWPMPKTETEFAKILNAETQDGKIQILVEEFLPEIANGEVRMWFTFGKFIAALKKHPLAGDFRVLIDEGSKIEAYTLTSPEEKLAAEVGLSLKNNGVGLAAIDFISGKICDYNLTSPGLLLQLEKVHGKNFAKEVIFALTKGG